MNQVQINKIINIKAEILAKKLFKEFKKTYVMKKKAKKKYRTFSLEEILTLKDDSIIKMVFLAIKSAPSLDRHQILQLVNSKSTRNIVQSTVSGRIWDLKHSNLIKSTGKMIGCQGKKVTNYSAQEVI